MLTKRGWLSKKKIVQEHQEKGLKTTCSATQDTSAEGTLEKKNAMLSFSQKELSAFH